MIDTEATTTKLIDTVEENIDLTGYFLSSRKNDFRLVLKPTVNEPELTTFAENNKTEDISETVVTSNEPIQKLRDIYFDDFISPELKTAVHLLETSQTLVVNAIESLNSGKLRKSDEYIMEFKSFLPELFCCRTISESFGAIISAIATALTNMNGCPLSEDQLYALYALITSLLREPAMSFEKAVEYVSDFEDADFEVESDGLHELLQLVELMDEPEKVINE